MVQRLSVVDIMFAFLQTSLIQLCFLKVESTMEQFQNSRMQGFRASPDLKPRNQPVDTSRDAENTVCCSFTNGYDNTKSSISIIK